MNKISTKQIVVVLSAIAMGLALSGCMSPQEESSIPWNTPQSWENQGPLGGLMNEGM